MPTRRQFIAGSGALAIVAATTASRSARAETTRTIVARTGTARLLESGQPETAIWGYDGTVPGPILRTRQGQPFAVDLFNQLPQPTTIHWHGIRIDNRMDGVAGLTQPAVQPGERFAYRFTPPDAGTYWYHPHNRTWEQLARGLQGAFIVEDDKPTAVDQDIVVIVDDWRLGRNGQIDETSLGSIHDTSHAGRLGNVLTLDGKERLELPVLAGERLRIRLINTANARIVGVIFAGHSPIVVALDGQPVAAPFAPAHNRVQLAPAQRADVILDCDGTPGFRTPITIDTGREKIDIGTLAYHATKRARAKILADIPILPANPLPAKLDLANVKVIDLDMTGGAMSAFRSGIYKGREMGIRELIREHGKAWAFNGLVGMPEKPLASIALGTVVAVRIVNHTAWPHAMHFHGHHVREIAHFERAPLDHWRDTVLVQRGEDVTVAFLADNPGKWMLHCHMLEHQAGGMSTWYEVG